MAAASSFFADLLPDDDLELNICISVELTFEEMSCVLEYIYSGTFQCLLQNKEKVLGILKDFGIFVPEHALRQNSKLISTSKVIQKDAVDIEEVGSVENIENRRTEAINCTNSVDSTLARAPLSKTNGPNNAFVSKLTNVKETTIQLEKNQNLVHENNRSKALNTSTNTKNRNFPISNNKPLHPKPDVNISNNPTTSLALRRSDPPSSKTPIILLRKSTSNFHKTQQTAKILPNNINANRGLVNGSGETTSKSKEIDNLVVQNAPNKEAVTLKLPEFIPSESTLFQKNSRTIDPLRTYGCETCSGIYSSSEPNVCQSVELDEPHSLLTTPEEQSLICDPPSLLISQPRRVYSRLKDVSRPKNKQNAKGLILRKYAIQNIKKFNGKVHILLNTPNKPVNPPVNPPVNLSVNPPLNPPVNSSINPPVNPPINKRVNPPVNSIQPEQFPDQDVILIEKPPPKKRARDETTIEDADDLILAQNFLKAERKRGQLLKDKLRWTERRSVQ